MSDHMHDIDRRSVYARRASTAAVMAVAVLVAACGGSGDPTSSATVAPATPAPASSDTPSAPPSPSPAPSAVTFVLPEPVPVASMAHEPALQGLWTAVGDLDPEACVNIPAVDPDGRVWAASTVDDAFLIIDRDGTVLETWGGAGAGRDDGELNLEREGNPGGDVVFAADGSFYVADTGNARVQQFDAERGFVRSFGGFGNDPGEFVSPHDIDLDDAGNVHVYDVARGDVQVFSPDGVFQRIAATGDVGPYAAVDAAGNVYTTYNEDVGTVQAVLYRYTPDGTVDLAVDVTAYLPFVTGIVVGPSGDIFMSGADNGRANVTYLSLLHLGPDGGLKHVWPHGAEALAVDPAGDRVYLTNCNENPGVSAYALPAS